MNHQYNLLTDFFFEIKKKYIWNEFKRKHFWQTKSTQTKMVELSQQSPVGMHTRWSCILDKMNSINRKTKINKHKKKQKNSKIMSKAKKMIFMEWEHTLHVSID